MVKSQPESSCSSFDPSADIDETYSPGSSEFEYTLQPAHFHSRPGYQFMAQRIRVYYRLIYQIEKWSLGRRQTLSYDPKKGLEQNAFDIVRNDWIDQGIWQYRWDILPGGRQHWTHERHSDYKIPDNIPISRVFPPAAPEPTPGHNREVLEQNPNAPQTILSGTNSSASRPYYQFLHQVAKDEDWIRDQLMFEQDPGCVDISTLAYEEVKKSWMQKNIWNPDWGNAPGMEWLHEKYDDDRLSSITKSEPVVSQTEFEGLVHASL